MHRRLTQKQDGYALDLHTGLSQRQSYINNYNTKNMAPATIDAAASRCAHNVKVLARLKELRQKAEDDSQATVLERKQLLAKILRVTPADVFDLNEDRNQLTIKAEAMSNPAVSYIRTDQVIVGKGDDVELVRISKLSLTDKVRAIAEYNKMEGVYEAEGSVTIDNRVLNIYVNSEKAKELTERLIEGERTE